MTDALTENTPSRPRTDYAPVRFAVAATSLILRVPKTFILLSLSTAAKQAATISQMPDEDRAMAAALSDYLTVKLIVTSVAPPKTLGPDRS